MVQNRSKERMAELGAFKTFSTCSNGDKVGLLLFAEEIEAYPAKGQKHVLHILRNSFFKNRTKLTNLNEGLEFKTK